jgi:hypothetical protein
MATSSTTSNTSFNPAVPQLPGAPVNYSQAQMAQFSNVLRLYLTQLSNAVATTTGGTSTATPTIYQWTTGAEPARPTTTSTYTWFSNTFTPVPSGWASSIPSNTTSGDILWAIQVPITANVNVPTTTIDWTNTAYPIIAISANGTPGSPGTNGTRTAVLTVFQWASSVPTTFPSGTSTYNWTNGTFTAPTTPNGWTNTPGASNPSEILYALDQVYTDTSTTSTSTVTWTTTSPYSTGAAGSNGSRTAFLQVYQWASTTPATLPSGTSTYTWATATYTAPSVPNGWTLVPGAPVAGEYLYVVDAVYSDTSTSAT